MFGKRETEVLVVGAGPVGLFTALSLVKRGRKVMIVDEEWRTAAHSYALAVHAGSLDLLEQLDVAGEMIRRGRQIRKVAFYDASERRAEVDLSVLPARNPMVLVLPQSGLEGLMEERLADLGTEVHWNHTLARLEPDGEASVATVEKLGKASAGYAAATTEWVIEKVVPVRARMVVGADGHRSVVRRSLGIEFVTKGAPQLFAVFEFETDFDPGDEVRVVIDEATTNVLWPLPDGRCRMSFQMPELEAPDREKSRVAVQLGRWAFPRLDRERLGDLLRDRAPWFSGSVSDLRWSLAVRFERRLAPGFGWKNVWLAGDSAHLAGPVGMWSMNVGMREGAELAWRYSDILDGRTTLDDLRQYDTGRAEEWRTLFGCYEKVRAQRGAKKWVRENASRILPCLPASGDHLSILADQLKLHLPADE